MEWIKERYSAAWWVCSLSASVSEGCCFCLRMAPMQAWPTPKWQETSQLGFSSSQQPEFPCAWLLYAFHLLHFFWRYHFLALWQRSSLRLRLKYVWSERCSELSEHNGPPSLLPSSCAAADHKGPCQSFQTVNHILLGSASSSFHSFES